MAKSFTNFLVRLAALFSLIGLISGYRQDDTVLKIAEVLMIVIWVQMDFKRIRSIFKSE